MTTLLKMELLLCRFSELEYRLPSPGLSPAESITIPPRLYFCCMLTTAFYTPHTNLTSSSHTTQPVSSGFSEWTSVHHHSVCSFCPSTLEDTITVHTVASLRPLRGLRFYFSYTLRLSNRHYFLSKSFSPSSQYITLEKKNLTCGVHGH